MRNPPSLKGRQEFGGTGPPKGRRRLTRTSPKPKATETAQPYSPGAGLASPSSEVKGEKRNE